jgi:hypothetical protein
VRYLKGKPKSIDEGYWRVEVMNEVWYTIEFECRHCQEWHEDMEVLILEDSYGVDTDCEKCGKNNYIELGD